MTTTETTGQEPTATPDAPLTQAQREKNTYIALLSELPKIYPNAFEKIVDGKGREIITTRIEGNPSVALNINRVIICEQGIFGLHRENHIPAKGVNFQGLLDSITSIGPEYGKGSTKDGWESHFPTQVLNPEYSASYGSSRVSFLKLDPTNEAHRSQLQYVFTINEQAESQRLKEEQLLNEKWDPKTILEGFKPKSS